MFDNSAVPSTEDLMHAIDCATEQPDVAFWWWFFAQVQFGTAKNYTVWKYVAMSSLLPSWTI